VVRAFLYCRTFTLPRTVNAAARYAAAQFYVLPRSVVPRTCMPPLTHGSARLYVQFPVLPRTHGAARGRTLRRLSLCCRASPMVPLSSTCGRASVLRCRAVLHIAAHCRMWPRSVTCCRAPMVPSAEQRFVSLPMLPRSVLDCYKRAVSSTVVGSRSAAVAEFGRRPIVVEYSRSTVVVGKKLWL